MTLLCELTDKYAKQPYLGVIGTVNEKYAPIIFGHHIYSFLYEYLLPNSGKVTSLEIIKPRDRKDEELFIAELKKYSPDLEDYTSVSEIEKWFPEERQMEDINIKEIATDLINNLTFVDEEVVIDGDFLIFLPLSDDKIKSLILASPNFDFEVYTNSKTAKLGNGNLIKLDPKSIKDVYGKMGELKVSYEKSFDSNIRYAKHYKALRYVENFKNRYYEELKETKLNPNERNIYFVGSDDFTATEGIDDLLGKFNYHENNLYQSIISFPEAEDKAVVFLNFTKLFGPNKQNQLSLDIRKRKLRDYIVLQGNNLQLITYFDEYKKVDVPDENEIRDLISGLFISLLVHNQKHEGEVRALYPFVKDSLLNNLLAESNNTKALYGSIKDFDKLNKDDLLDNISFWCVFLDRYKSKLDEFNKRREDLISQNIEPVTSFSPPPEYQFVRRKGNNFKIVFNGQEVVLPRNDYVGLLYIQGILRSNKKEEHVSDLFQLARDIVDNNVEQTAEIAKNTDDGESGTMHVGKIPTQKYDVKSIHDLNKRLANIEELRGLYEFDPEKSNEDDALEKEEKYIKSELRKARTKNGKIRKSATDEQNDYKKVSKAIDLVFDRIKDVDRKFYKYLKDAIKYKRAHYIYEYHPTPEVDWILDD